MMVLPADSGMSEMKSTAICDQGECGVANGSSFPTGRCRGTLALVQTLQEAIYLFTSRVIEGHQYLPWISSSILLVPG